MPNVSRKRLLQSIRKEKNTVAGERLRACLHRKDGCSIRRICKIMVRPYSTMRDWLWRMQEGGIRCRHDKERGPTRVQDTQEGIQGCQALGEEGAERFQIRVGLVAAEPVARDDQGAFRAGMQRAHASQVAAQKQALVEKIQARTVQDSLQKRTDGVQAKGRRAGVPDARGRIRRVYRRRGCNPDAAKPSTAGGPRAGGRRARPRFQQDRSGCLAQCQKTGSSSRQSTLQTRRRSKNS